MNDLTLRRALPAELELIVAIDDRAAVLFQRAGISFDHLPPQHPFVLAEHRRWQTALSQGRVWFAELGGDAVGVMVLGHLDGSAYLDQLSVVPQAMRRGIGGTLIAQACSLSASSPALWLTTYEHLPWNRPYYERFGFVAVSECDCGPQLRAMLDEQKSALPLPEQRVAMRKTMA
jgi:GNAT superfamily N-acetyltransferase